MLKFGNVKQHWFLYHPAFHAVRIINSDSPAIYDNGALTPSWNCIQTIWVVVTLRTKSTPCSHQQKTSVADPVSDPGGQKWPTNIEKVNTVNFIFWSAGCSLLRAEGFSCSLKSFLEAKGQANCNLRHKKIYFFSAVVFWNFWLWNPGSKYETGFTCNAGSGSGFRGSTTLHKTMLTKIQEPKIKFMMH